MWTRKQGCRYSGLTHGSAPTCVNTDACLTVGVDPSVDPEGRLIIDPILFGLVSSSPEEVS